MGQVQLVNHITNQAGDLHGVSLGHLAYAQYNGPLAVVTGPFGWWLLRYVNICDGTQKQRGVPKTSHDRVAHVIKALELTLKRKEEFLISITDLSA